MPIKLKQINSSLTSKIIDRSVLGSNLIWGYTGIPCGSDSDNNGWHLKTMYQMYNNSKFIKVYRDGVELTYNSDWVWGRPIGGSMSDMSHSIRFNIGVYAAGSTYRVVYTEYNSGITPSMYLYRTDGLGMRNKMITNRIHYDSGLGGPCDNTNLVVWEIAEMADYAYDVKYGKTTPITPPYDCETTIHKNFGTHLSVREFGENEDMSPWRLEMWNFGNKRGGSSRPIGNINLNPHKSSIINRIELPNNLSMGNIYTGLWVSMLRNTDLNIVTGFSSRRLFVRRRALWQEGYYGDSFIGAYFQTGLI